MNAFQCVMSSFNKRRHSHSDVAQVWTQAVLYERWSRILLLLTHLRSSGHQSLAVDGRKFVCVVSADKLLWCGSHWHESQPWWGVGSYPVRGRITWCKDEKHFLVQFEQDALAAFFSISLPLVSRGMATPMISFLWTEEFPPFFQF